MKKILFIALLGILIVNCNSKNAKETRNLQKFDKVTIVGNIELNLEKNTDRSIEIMSENEADIADLTTEVRNGELFIKNDNVCDHCNSPKYIINLSYTSISALKLTGVVKINSYDVINQKSLSINGNGIFHGNIETSVNKLYVDLKGISNIKISGNSDISHINLKGIGMVNASDLKTKNDQSDSKGIAFIYM